jgi:hypothetical protein
MIDPKEHVDALKANHPKSYRFFFIGQWLRHKGDEKPAYTLTERQTKHKDLLISGWEAGQYKIYEKYHDFRQPQQR